MVFVLGCSIQPLLKVRKQCQTADFPVKFHSLINFYGLVFIIIIIIIIIFAVCFTVKVKNKNIATALKEPELSLFSKRHS